MAKYKRAWWLLVVVAVVGALLVWRATRTREVETVQVTAREVVEVYIATGQVRAPQEVPLGMESAGRVERVLVTAGDRPDQGQPLLELAPMDARLALKRAQAQVEVAQGEFNKVKAGPVAATRRAAQARVQRAEVELEGAQREQERVQGLVQQGVATRAELERAQLTQRRAQSDLRLAQAQLQELVQQPRGVDLEVARGRLEQAQADLEAVQRGLGKTSLEAPAAGIVLGVEVAPGQVVQPGQVALRLAPLEQLEVYVEVNEEYFGRLEAGMEATCSFVGLGDTRVPARVRQVGPEVDSDRGVVGVHIAPKEIPGRVLPGLTVDVAMELRRVPQARAVPRGAVLRQRGQQAVVFAVVEGRARRRPVTVSVEGEAFLGVEGVEEGVVLVADATTVEEGQAVRPLPTPSERP